jgi:hypothetical protein
LQDYEPVTKALAEGADPAMLCATCPWDRNCVNPPSMTAGEVKRQMEEASARDQATMTAARLSGQDVPLPAATLIMAAVPGEFSVEFWAEHAKNGLTIAHAYQVFGTGHPLPDGAEHVATCPRTAEGLVFHLYEMTGGAP